MARKMIPRSCVADAMDGIEEEPEGVSKDEEHIALRDLKRKEEKKVPDIIDTQKCHERNSTAQMSGEEAAVEEGRRKKVRD